MEDISIAKFVIKGKTLYIKINWEKSDCNLFSMKVYDGSNSWSGRFSNLFADKFRKGVAETKEEYLRNIKTVMSDSNTGFSYEFSTLPEDPDKATFSWIKSYEGEGSSGVRVHGTVPVHRDNPPESKDILIDYLLVENQELSRRVSDFKHRNNKMTISLEECRNNFEQFINVKNTLESNLYSKFTQLLNTKKRRIQVLEENLRKYDKCDTDYELD